MTNRSNTAPLAIALHGGSGTIRRDDLDPELERSYRDALSAALEAGWGILRASGRALDAVEAAARVLEDCPLFNAGHGAVFTSQGTHELDAAVMCGRERAAGAVAGVRTARNPVQLARRVLEDGRFVLLAGEGADAFARDKGVELVDPSWFSTEERRRQLEVAQAGDRVVMDHDAKVSKKFGTIGVVALDAAGDLAAATSTGGLTNKVFGRVGDSPLPGAGTYADNATCAVSCTGYGEEFIRAVVAHDVAARMEYLGESLEAASRSVIMDRLPRIGGCGGLVAVDRFGNVSLPFNTEGMYRAWRSSLGGEGVSIFGNE